VTDLPIIHVRRVRVGALRYAELAVPGITAKNAGYVMSRVRSMRELCELRLDQVQDILGNVDDALNRARVHLGLAVEARPAFATPTVRRETPPPGGLTAMPE